MTEIRTLSLGGGNAAVTVRESAEAPEDAVMTTRVVEFADKLLEAHTNGTVWTRRLFRDRSGSDIVQAIGLFTQKVNLAQAEKGKPLLNVLALEELINQLGISLALPLQNLCRWAVLVRLGVRTMRRDLMGMVAMVPMPLKGAVKLRNPTDRVGRTHHVVTHVFGTRLVARGYSLRMDSEARWHLGGARGNRWCKDLWITPGLHSVDALVTQHRRKLTPGRNKKQSRRDERNVNYLCKVYQNKIIQSRKSAGIQVENFGSAYGARLDLENKAVMAAVLSSVRALLAQAIVYKEDRLLDDIAGRCGRAKADLLDEPALAGREEEAFREHFARRTVAHTYFRACGRFALPMGYMVFAEHGVPKHIEESARTQLPGVSGVAVSSAYLVDRLDAAALRCSPAVLPEIEDLSPLIDACGVSTIKGSVADNLRLVTLDAAGEEADDGVEHMRYDVDGEVAEMPLDEFLRRAAVKFIPMVKDFQRRRLFVEDLQGSASGIAWAMSFDDIKERFRACKKKSDT